MLIPRSARIPRALSPLSTGPLQRIQLRIEPALNRPTRRTQSVRRVILERNDLRIGRSDV